MEFRQKALSKLQSPEELDVPVRFARPQGRIVLIVTIAIMAAASFWAVTGTISSKVNAPGILTHQEGSYVLQSPVAGQVTKVLAEEGDMLPEGAPLLGVQTDRGVRAVRTVAAGRVTSMVAKIGSVVTPGADVATIEKISNAQDPLVAVLYVPGDNGASVPVGTQVDLTVQSVPTQQFGVLRGKVKAVGRPQTRQQITNFLGDSQLGAQFAAQGKPVAVLVQLDRSSTTKSGYRWSSENGPPYKLDSTIPVSGAIHLSEQRPVDWLLP